jgi:hypothetical protein
VDAERIVRRATTQVEEQLAAGGSLDNEAVSALSVQAERDGEEPPHRGIDAMKGAEPDQGQPGPKTHASGRRPGDDGYRSVGPP